MKHCTLICVLAVLYMYIGGTSSGIAPMPAGSTAVAANYFILTNQSSIFNESVTVPIWERTDTPSPLPGMVAAEDFTMPATLQVCHELIADLVLFRQLGREGSNYRSPANLTFWLFTTKDMSGPFNASKALFHRTFEAPTEGAWTPVGSSGGKTVDHGTGFYYHVERLRFVMPGVTLRAGSAYWLAVRVSIERAYNSTDFTQNTVRLATSEDAAHVSLSEPYRVVDTHGNMFRGNPLLRNWTIAASAEADILPSFTSLNARTSTHQQLALDIYVHNCSNVTRLGRALVPLNALPPRDIPEAVSVPVPIPMPSPAPSDLTPSPEANVNVPVVVIPIPSRLLTPSPVLIPVPSSSKSSAPSPVPVPVPVPVHVSPIAETEHTPSSSSGHGNGPVATAASPTYEPSALVTAPPASILGSTPTSTWAMVVIIAVLALIVLGGGLYLVTRIIYNKKFVDLPMAKYIASTGGHDTDNDEDGSLSAEEQRSSLSLYRDTPLPPAFNADSRQVALQDVRDYVPRNKEEAAQKQDTMLMSALDLNDD